MTPSAVPTTMPDLLPAWAQEMREVFKGGTVSQFLIHGNVFDLVSDRTSDPIRFLSVRDYLTEVMFARFEVVLAYNRGTGVRAVKGKDEFQKFLKLSDEWMQTSYTGNPLPRDPLVAFDLMDRFVRYSHHRTVIQDGVPTLSPIKTAVILEFVQFMVPAGEASHLGDGSTEILIRLLDWASDPNLVGSQAVGVLLA
ncbi:MAG TPA: hypothetical protein VGO93_02325, partial [Candidatus Xenobia bacterium]